MGRLLLKSKRIDLIENDFFKQGKKDLSISGMPLKSYELDKVFDKNKNIKMDFKLYEVNKSYYWARNFNKTYYTFYAISSLSKTKYSFKGIKHEQKIADLIKDVSNVNLSFLYDISKKEIKNYDYTEKSFFQSSKF